MRATRPKLELVDTIEVHMEGRLEDYEKETLMWWQNKPIPWSIIKAECISNEKAAEQIIEFIKKWENPAIIPSRTLKIVTDNCWFDDTWISWFLCTYGKQFGGLPLHENYYTGYTKLDYMIDINQRIKAITADMGMKIGSFIPSVLHDHTPVADSRGIVERYVHYMSVLKSYRSRSSN